MDGSSLDRPPPIIHHISACQDNVTPLQIEYRGGDFVHPLNQIIAPFNSNESLSLSFLPRSPILLLQGAHLKTFRLTQAARAVASFVTILPPQFYYCIQRIKMKSAAVLLSLAASATAFAPAPSTSRVSVAVQETKADLQALAKDLNPVLGFYDPLNLAEASFWGTTNEETIGFLRHSEIK
jgi:hypothetical protein